MNIGNIVLTTAEFNEMCPTATEKAQFILALSKKKAGTQKEGKKPSINGAPIDVEPTVEEKDGFLSFKHSAYALRKKGGYAVADLVTAKGLIEAEQFESTNRQTGVRYVQVNGAPIGENLVFWAEKGNFI